MSDLAARLRDAFLGTETGEAVPFDELKDAVKDRWQRVADAAREVPPEGIALAAARERGRRAALRVPSVEELATIGHEANTNFVVHEDAATAIRDAVLAGLPTGEHAPIRVPFTDAQIERMAKAARETLLPDEPEDGAYWPHWLAAIRAALAAGGLEPCAVPEYEPDDVALMPTGHVLRDRLVEAEAKIERQRKNLRQLYEARARDAQLIADLRAEVDEDNAAAASVNDLLVQVQNLTAERDGLQKRNDVQAEQVRRLDSEISPLMAEIAALRERASVPVPAGDPTADQVEALARVLHKSQDAFYCRYGDHATKFDDHTPLWSTMARAAIAHLATRPEGLPTAEELDRIAEAAFDANYDTKFAATRAILTALRPWLRDPVEFELDVTADEIVKAIVHDHRDTLKIAQAVLDLCRSRISPVYECKECAARREDMMSAPDVKCAVCLEWEKKYNNMMRWHDDLDAKLCAVRAALEGE